MSSFVGILLVVVAAGTIVGVMWFVMREHHEHEEHYVPPARSERRTETAEPIEQVTGAEVVSPKSIRNPEDAST